MPNLSSLAYLEVPEKSVVVGGGGGGIQVATMSEFNASCFRIALS